MSRAPTTLTVVLADTFRTRIAIQYENEGYPYQRRSVQIELTPEQRAALEPRKVGESGGFAVFEDVLECWLEPVESEPVKAKGF